MRVASGKSVPTKTSQDRLLLLLTLDADDENLFTYLLDTCFFPNLYLSGAASIRSNNEYVAGGRRVRNGFASCLP